MSFSREQTKKTNEEDFLSRTSKANISLKRTFLFSFINVKDKGSATLEALIILPVCFYFFMVIIWIFSLFYFKGLVDGIVCDEGYTIVSNSYRSGSKFINDDTLINKIKTENLLCKYLYDISCEMNTDFEENVISITVSFKVNPLIIIPGSDNAVLNSVFYSKGYNGKSVDDSNDEMVYITKDSEVYHTQKNCSALKTDIYKSKFSEIKAKRNLDKKKYYPCNKCKMENVQIVYYTPYGRRYHADEKCSFLKTTIYTVRKTEIEGRKKCSFCY